jgi:hypothetical protein
MHLIRNIRYALIAPILLGGFVMSFFEDTKPRIYNIYGEVSMKERKSASWKKVSSGTLIQDGDELMTGPESKAWISFNKQRMRIDSNSHLVLTSINRVPGAHEIQLLKGYVWFDADKSKTGFSVKTNTVYITAQGSRFSVYSTDNESLVGVCSGFLSAIKEGRDTELKKGDAFWTSKVGKDKKSDFRDMIKGYSSNTAFVKHLSKDERLKNCISCHRPIDKQI